MSLGNHVNAAIFVKDHPEGQPMASSCSGWELPMASGALPIYLD